MPQGIDQLRLQLVTIEQSKFITQKPLGENPRMHFVDFTTTCRLIHWYQVKTPTPKTLSPAAVFRPELSRFFSPTLAGVGAKPAPATGPGCSFPDSGRGIERTGLSAVGLPSSLRASEPGRTDVDRSGMLGRRHSIPSPSSNVGAGELGRDPVNSHHQSADLPPKFFSFGGGLRVEVCFFRCWLLSTRPTTGSTTARISSAPLIFYAAFRPRRFHSSSVTERTGFFGASSGQIFSYSVPSSAFLCATIAGQTLSGCSPRTRYVASTWGCGFPREARPTVIRAMRMSSRQIHAAACFPFDRIDGRALAQRAFAARRAFSLR